MDEQYITYHAIMSLSFLSDGCLDDDRINHPATTGSTCFLYRQYIDCLSTLIKTKEVFLKHDALGYFCRRRNPIFKHNIITTNFIVFSCTGELNVQPFYVLYIIP